jgi:glutathione S-transferase
MTIRSGKEHTTRYLFGQRACAADAMYAPVCSRFVTYDVALDDDAAGYSRTIMDCSTRD